MRFTTLAFAGLLGTLVLTGDASACHKKKCTCATPAPVVCAPAPVKVKTVKMKHHHKKAACETVAYAPVSYAAPAHYASSQGPMSSSQAPMGTMQAPMGTMQAPSKSM